VLKSSYAQFVYLLQGADDEQMDRMREYLKTLCAGWPVQQVRDIVAETLHELIDPLVYAEAVALFDEHHAAGRDVVLVSSSGEEVVGPIGDMLGADSVVATRMVVVDGRYTGEIEFYAYGEGKAVALRTLADEHGYDLARCYAYSDSATDLPMLEAVGHPHAVNPDRALRRAATERGWPVLDFRRPVRARERFRPLPTPPGPPSAYVAVLAGMGFGLVWWALRRPDESQQRGLADGTTEAYKGTAGLRQAGGRRLPPTRVRACEPGTHVRPASRGSPSGVGPSGRRRRSGGQR
jgi:HAD superfamily hydrolase (TIGR01490 family)